MHGYPGAPAGAFWALLEHVSDMTKVRRALRGLRSEGGFTLAELLVAMMITLIAFAATLLLLQVALKAQPRISERGAAIQQGRAWIERLTRELRQGGTVAGSPGSSQLSFLTDVRHSSCGGTATGNSIACLVTYSCSAGTCSRTERNPNGSGTAPAQQMVTGLQSNSVSTVRAGGVHRVRGAQDRPAPAARAHRGRGRVARAAGGDRGPVRPLPEPVENLFLIQEAS